MRRSMNSIKRRIAVACVSTAVFLGTGAAVYAYGGQIVRQIFGWEGNMTITNTVDPDSGDNRSTVTMEGSVTDPIEVKDGRLIFIVNGENTDITDIISESSPYNYEYIDEEGYVHYWIIGISDAAKGEYGYSEYIADSSGEWMGGYSHNTGLDAEGHGSEWFEIGKDKIGCPW